ncbi:hypothetical protein GCM10011404_26400 [Sphingomonas prati]|uniref:Uncharacterized protein n=1 Tax=Sphingomonas prati TaxID=1843237 RepID=A0A7W9F2A8_9SPHN|nr:hypothetical protein [Sphingomonas prati]MBB5730188.1 hypothetical protein [Sphingomonas prati]GGE92213.1 hypothetical protein GCM10011404_26400 [Sphingomonas prati]
MSAFAFAAFVLAALGFTFAALAALLLDGTGAARVLDDVAGAGRRGGTAAAFTFALTFAAFVLAAFAGLVRGGRERRGGGGFGRHDGAGLGDHEGTDADP